MTSLFGFLGHGRALEAFLGSIKLLVALLVLPGWHSLTPIVSDLPHALVFVPFAWTGTLQITGLWLNYKGVESSWVVRTVAALSAMMMWSWIITKYLLIGALFTSFSSVLACSFIAGSFIASSFILWKAVNRLPIPGVTGLS